MYIFAPFPAIAVSVAKFPARIATNTVLAIKHMDQPGGLYDYWSGSSSPGGGGPGQSLTSTKTPPSVEEVGDLLMEISKTGRGYGFDITKSRTSNGRRCPPGYRWDKKRRKCVRIRKY